MQVKSAISNIIEDCLFFVNVVVSYVCTRTKCVFSEEAVKRKIGTYYVRDSHLLAEISHFHA